jgi:hypothetical protein
MNPYLVERLSRERRAALLMEAQELRETRGISPRPGALLARLRTWALQLVSGGGREPLWRTKGGRAQRRRA